jgi:hypothetical protein
MRHLGPVVWDAEEQLPVGRLAGEARWPSEVGEDRPRVNIIDDGEVRGLRSGADRDRLDGEIEELIGEPNLQLRDLVDRIQRTSDDLAVDDLGVIDDLGLARAEAWKGAGDLFAWRTRVVDWGPQRGATD